MTGRSHLGEAIEWAAFAPQPGFATRSGAKRGRRAEGLRYERKVQAYLMAMSARYAPGPWIRYSAGGKILWCQPDGVHFDFNSGEITIVEIKYAHTREAHRQLRGVYEPVVRQLLGNSHWTLRLVEICKWYDPDILFPEPVSMIADPFAHRQSAIGVHIWRP